MLLPSISQIVLKSSTQVELGLSLGCFFSSLKKEAEKAHIFVYSVQGKQALRDHSATTKAKSETLDFEHFQKDVLDF